MGTRLLKSEKFEFFFNYCEQFIWLCLLTTLVSVALTGCGQPGSIEKADQSTSQSPEGGPVVPMPEVSAKVAEAVPEESLPALMPIKVIKHSTEVNVTETNRADVIIVIDNSASMKYEQANMAQRFSSLMDEMKGLDWRLGIITTDVSQDAPKKDGRFLEFAGVSSKYFLSSEMNIETVKKVFAATIQRPLKEGNSNEQGIKATYRALERKPDWLRANAALNVVVVTDANETPFKNKPEIRNSPQELLKFVKSEYPSKNFFFHSIVVKDGDSVCLKKDGNESYGKLYVELSKLTGGIVGDVCQKDYGKQLKMIGEKVAQKIKSVELECSPIEKTTRVLPQFDEPILDFSLEKKILKLARPLPVGHTEIEYLCDENAGN
jgi:hypothetical protein